MKKLPVGIQTFEMIRTEDFLYVDKTQEIYNLLTESRRYFLSRPRRFGKSLLCSTLASLFEGRKDLFQGLWIEKSDWQWKKHPVVHISFAGITRRNPDELCKGIVEFLARKAQEQGVVLPNDITLTEQFTLLIQHLSQQAPVVIIIDEYDKPILDHITDLETAKQMRSILKELYEAVKDMDRYLQFVFITGVTKFTKTSIFSGINNLRDISLEAIGATLCGFTHKEVAENFGEYVEALTTKRKVTEEKVLDDLAYWYDGYRFDVEDDEELVYNPFSLLNVFVNRRFQNYWFASGTPTFLIDLIKSNQYPVLDLQQMQIAASDMISFEPEAINLAVLMQQAGYVTICDYNEASENYTVTYPNYEVFSSLMRIIIPLMTNIQTAAFNNYVVWFSQALQAGDIDHFCKTLQQYFTEIPYTIHLSKEKYYQTIFFVICRMLTRKVFVEQQTNRGAIDAVLEYSDRTVIIEFKLNQTAQIALQQIKDKEYAQAYRSRGKEILLVGVNFDLEQRNVTTDWVVEKD